MIKNPVKLIINLFFLGYFFGLFSKLFVAFETISIIIYIINTLVLILFTFKKKNQLLIVILFLSIFIIFQKTFYLNDNVRLLNNLMLLFIPPIKFFNYKRHLLYFFLILFIFICIDFFFIPFERDLSSGNKAYGLFRAGNEMAVFAVIVMLFYKSKLSNIFLLIAGLLSSVKLIIVAALSRLINKFKIISLILFPLFLIEIFNYYLKFNVELNNLIDKGNISLLSIISSFRYDRMLNELAEMDVLNNDFVGYFEMDLFDVYFSLSFLGIIVAIIMYYKLYKLFFTIDEKMLFFIILLYSIFYGHVLFSTSLGLLIISIKHLIWEIKQKYQIIYKV